MTSRELLSLLNDTPPEGARRPLFAVKTRIGKEALWCRDDIHFMGRRIANKGANNEPLDLDERAWADEVAGATLLHRHVKVTSHEPLKWEPV